MGDFSSSPCSITTADLFRVMPTFDDGQSSGEGYRRNTITIDSYQGYPARGCRVTIVAATYLKGGSWISALVWNCVSYPTGNPKRQRFKTNFCSSAFVDRVWPFSKTPLPGKKYSPKWAPPIRWCPSRRGVA